MSLLAMVLAAATAVQAAGDESSRRPVPDAATQKEQEVLIRGVFKAEYAKTAWPARKALAATLLQQAGQTLDNPAARYVLLRECRDIAADVCDIFMSFAAIDSMAAEYRVNALSLKVASLGATSKMATKIEDFRNLSAWYQKTADEAVAEDEFEVALMAAGKSVTMARAGKDPLQVSRADIKNREVAELKTKFDAVRKFRETLVTNPEDEAANAAVGEYTCLVRGNWTAGLKLLAKGSGRFRDLAQRDVSEPTKPEEQAAVADGWWDAAEKERGRAQENLRRRAATWYEKAGPGLSGILQLKVNQRLSSLAPAWMAANLFAYWKMDENAGSNLIDSSGKGRNGKIEGATWAKGISGSGLHFDGGGQKVLVDAGEVPVPWTAAVWVFREDTPNPIARITDGTSYDKGISLRVEQATRSHKVGITKYRVADHSFDYVAPLNAWTHLVWVCNPKGVAAYANGVQIGAVELVVPLSLDRLGTQDQGALKGTLDEFRIYSRDLTGAEIEALYQHHRR